MSKDGLRWVEGTMFGLALVSLGCADDADDDDDVAEGETVGDGDGDPTGDGDGDGDSPNDIPLELELARFNATGKWLLLRFSEPMAAVDGVDPNDFRVSLGRTTRSQYYGDVYQSSSYVDPLRQLDYQYNYYYYDYNTLEIDLVLNGQMATDIVLRFVDPIGPEHCSQYADLAQAIAEYDAQDNVEAQVGLFPHYSPGAVSVRALDGEVLQAIGPNWVEYDGSWMYTSDFGWPALNPRIDIPCDVDNEP